MKVRDLLKSAEEDGFTVVVTADQSIFYQRNHRQRTIAPMVLSTNDRTWLEPAVEAIRGAIGRARPGSFERVEVKRPV